MSLEKRSAVWVTKIMIRLGYFQKSILFTWTYLIHRERRERVWIRLHTCSLLFHTRIGRRTSGADLVGRGGIVPSG
jgi:hypothetical protein